MQRKVRYPKYDIGDFLPSPGEDWFWGEGILSDGRPYRAEVYYQGGGIYMELYMSSRDIENFTVEQFKEYMISEQLLEFYDNLYRESGFNGDNLEIAPKEDASGNAMWNLKFIIGDEDGTYVRILFKRNHYDYLNEVNKAPELEEYLLAIGEAYNTLHPCILVNNSDFDIEIVISRPPVGKILGGIGIDEVIKNMQGKDSGHFIQGPVPLETTMNLIDTYFDWEFDFNNKKYLFLKTQNKELLIGFFLNKWFTCCEVKEIPFTDLKGWLCPAKLIMERGVVKKATH